MLNPRVEGAGRVSAAKGVGGVGALAGLALRKGVLCKWRKLLKGTEK